MSARVRRDATRGRRGLGLGTLPQALALCVVALFAAGLLVMHSRLAGLEAGRNLSSSSAELSTGRGGRRRQIWEAEGNASATLRGRAPGINWITTAGAVPFNLAARHRKQRKSVLFCDENCARLCDQ